MYSPYNALIKRLESANEQGISYKKNDLRKALGALLYRVILVDGRVRPEEIELFRSIVETNLGVTEDELIGFEESVQELATSKENFDQLVSGLKILSDSEKSEIVTFMQDISISDREFHELELNLVSQISQLLRG